MPCIASDTPGGKPNVDTVHRENEGCHCVVRGSFGDFSLLYEIQTDAVHGEGPGFTSNNVVDIKLCEDVETAPKDFSQTAENFHNKSLM